MVIDLAGLIDGQSPWDIQLWALRERLQEITAQQLKIAPVSEKPPHKKVLLRRLKMFDLLSDGTPLDKAALGLATSAQTVANKQTITHLTSLYLQIWATNPGHNVLDIQCTSPVYRHGYVVVARREELYTLQGSQAWRPNSIALADESDERASDW